MSVDFGDLDDDALKMRGGSGKRWFGVLVGLSVLGGLATVGATRPGWAEPVLGRIGLSSAHTEVAAAAIAPPALPAPAPDPVPAPVAAPAAVPDSMPGIVAGGAADSPMNPRFTNRLSDDQKSRLADTDKQKASGHKGRAAGGAAHSSAAPSKSGKSPVFTTGGSKFDPLNSSI